MRCSRFLAVCMLTIMSLALPARGQGGSMSMSIFNDGSTFAPELSRADLDVFKRVLSLKDEEMRAMEDLYGAYCNTLKDEGLAVRTFVSEKMEESEAMADQRLLDPAQKRLSEWEKRSEQLKKSFMEDLKSLLTRDQEARWPIVERELRRMKMLSWGRIPGEQVDLVKLVEDLPGEAKQSAVLGDLLERYSQDMDRVLVSRTQFMEKNNEKFHELVTSDPPEAKKLYERATREREAVAGVNDRYLREICAEVPPEEAQKLRDRYFKLSYYLLAKGTRGERYITAAGKIENLTKDQRQQVDAILAEYDRERRVIVGKMAEITREEKATRLPDNLVRALNPPAPGEKNEHVNEWARGLPDGHPMLDLRRSRFELDKTYRGKVDAVLTPEQRDTLPDLALEAVTYFDDSPGGL